MAIGPYIEIARIDHWFKNAFMLLGLVVAVFFEPDLLSWDAVPQLVLALLATCLIASSNYVLNEILDAPYDGMHPVKKNRPVPAGQVSLPIAYAEWLGLVVAGLGLAWMVNVPFTLAALALWVMGCLYNVRPFRTKDIPYLDVITESVNNPIRLLLGWFAVISDRFPQVSLLLSYWALGAFFMGTKRFAELRMIGNRDRAASYRRSFAHYTEENLLVSMFFYVTACAFFGGVFIMRSKIELVLSVPFLSAMFAFYLRLGLKENSPVQNPERLYQERGFFVYTVLCFLLFVVLMFTQIPILYEWFRFDPPKLVPLWVIG
jgi:decaprenyl-phosphate phosphoribosyltransferase